MRNINLNAMNGLNIDSKTQAEIFVLYKKGYTAVQVGNHIGVSWTKCNLLFRQFDEQLKSIKLELNAFDISKFDITLAAYSYSENFILASDKQSVITAYNRMISPIFKDGE